MEIMKMMFYSSCFCLSLVFTAVRFSKADAVDFRKPIWNVAHMVNARYQVNHYLNRGANSVEFDVTFGVDGVAAYTYHGIPCDCFRTCNRYEYFNVFLEHLRITTAPDSSNFRKELVLLFMDLKVKGLSYSAQSYAGKDIAQQLVRGYLRPEGKTPGRSYILISLPSINNIGLVNSFRQTMEMLNATEFLDRIGYDFSGNENINSISSVLNSIGVKENIWQGDGITNCLPRGTSRLMQAIGVRDDTRSPHVNKVYWWTVDRMSTMRRTLDLGVDALITNNPERLKDVLNEDEYSRILRLATIEDDPWKNISPRTARLLDDRPMGRSGYLTERLDDEEEMLYNS